MFSDEELIAYMEIAKSSKSYDQIAELIELIDIPETRSDQSRLLKYDTSQEIHKRLIKRQKRRMNKN